MKIEIIYSEKIKFSRLKVKVIFFIGINTCLSNHAVKEPIYRITFRISAGYSLHRMHRTGKREVKITSRLRIAN